MSWGKQSYTDTRKQHLMCACFIHCVTLLRVLVISWQHYNIVHYTFIGISWNRLESIYCGYMCCQRACIFVGGYDSNANCVIIRISVLDCFRSVTNMQKYTLYSSICTYIIYINIVYCHLELVYVLLYTVIGIAPLRSIIKAK